MPTHARPCPWCGAEQRHLEGDINDFNGDERLRCGNCGQYGPWGKDGDESLAAWNTRPIEDAMLALLIEHSGDPDALCSCDDWMVTPAGTKCLNCRTKALIADMKGGS